MLVLMVLDAAEESQQLLDYVRTAHEADAEFLLLSVSLSGREADLQSAENVLQEALRALDAELGPKLRTRLEIGEPAEVVTRVAQAERADVIMMPAYAEGDFPRLQELGAVAHEVAHRTNLPIVIASPVGLEALLRDQRIVTVPAH